MRIYRCEIKEGGGGRMGEGVRGRVEINKITISDVSHFIADDIRPETLLRPCAIFLHNISLLYFIFFLHSASIRTKNKTRTQIQLPYKIVKEAP